MKLRWRHVVVGTHNSWLHGDPRGFRDRDHRTHSSGDYKDPPPPGEHAGLHRYFQNRAGNPVDLGHVDARVIVCRTFVTKWRHMGYRVIAAAVGRRHLHAIVEGPDDHDLLTKEVGRAKQKASHAVRHRHPGTVWSANATLKPIRGPGHFRNSYKYVRTGQEGGSVVWSHRPDENWADDVAVDLVVMRAKRDPVRIPQAGM